MKDEEITLEHLLSSHGPVRKKGKPQSWVDSETCWLWRQRGHELRKAEKTDRFSPEPPGGTWPILVHCWHLPFRPAQDWVGALRCEICINVQQQPKPTGEITVNQSKANFIFFFDSYVLIGNPYGQCQVKMCLQMGGIWAKYMMEICEHVTMQPSFL